MSGVLELAASVAGVAGFATLACQPGEGLLKLEELRRKLRDALATLEHAVACIIAVEVQLEAIKNHTTSFARSPPLDAALALCGRSVNKINHVIDMIDQTWSRSERLGKLKFTLKEKEMRDLLKRLEQE